MTRVGNIDQVLLLLREQLQRAGKGASAGRKGSVGGTERSAARPLDRVRALAALDSLNDEDVRRALIRGLLTEEFGEKIGNDAAFQGIVNDVLRIIGDTPGGVELLDRSVAQLKAHRA